MQTDAAPRRGQALWIYVLPALLDMVLSLVLFVATVRAAKLGGDATRSASVLAVWSLVYVASCPLVGRLVTPRNAPRFVLAGCLLFTLTCGLLTATSGLPHMLALVGVAGVAAALFFPAFQVFMKDVDAAGGRTLACSTGLYTFAWSTGFACGPFVSGVLMQLGARDAAGGEGSGWMHAFAFGAVVCLLTSAAVALALRGRGCGPRANAERPPAAPNARYASMPDLAWLGWVGAGAAFAALSIIRSVFPARALGELRLAEGMLGALFFALSMTQALAGLALTRSRFWMYRPGPIAAFGAAGFAGILLFGMGRHPAVFLGGAMLFGTYTGAFCFYMVFHSLVHPERAGRYVAVNEALVGITGFLAPLAGGLMADAWGFRWPYLCAAGLMLVATAVQVRVTRAAS